MKLQLFVAAAAVGAASLLGAGGATALPLSGCTLNGESQTCNLYESDPNGSPSEISSVNSAFAEWTPGYFKVYDNSLSSGVISDIVIFTSSTATLYSFDDGGSPPPGYPGNPSILLGTTTEDQNGFADFLVASVTIDRIDIFSPPDAVPEPVTVSIFGAGLVGAAAMRRRRKRNAA